MNQRDLNALINGSRGRFVGLTLQTSRRRETVSAKITGSSDNYLTLSTYKNGNRTDRKVNKNSIVSAR